MKYISLEEAAKLEEISYKGFTTRIYRDSSSYKIKTEASENGGKDRILVSIESLSKKARRTFKEKITAEGELKKMIVNKNSDAVMPWYVDIDCQWYIDNYKKQYYKAVELSRYIEQFMGYSGTNKTEYADKLARDLNMSSRTLFRKTKAVLEGSAWAIKMSEKDGKNYNFYKVLALCTKPKEKGKYPSITAIEKAYIENIWFDDMFAQNNGTIAMCYSAYLSKCEAEGWEPVSYPTINRYINGLMETKSSAHALVAKGTRDWKNKNMIKARRNTGALKVMEIVQADSHTFDCWVTVDRANGTRSVIRPILVALLDTRSRCFVGWGICETPNSQVIKQIMINMIYEKKDPEVPFYGVPEYLLIDNGKDYTAENLTGRKRTERVSFDMETKGFYRSIGIKDDIRSLPYQAWGKGQVERSFRTVCNRFTKWIESYVGTLTGSKTSDKVKKDLKKLEEDGRILSIEEFTNRFAEYLKTDYHVKKHTGLKEQNEKNPTPIGVYMNGERYMMPPPPMEYTEMLLMKSDNALVRNVGIRKFGFDYLADELGNYIGKHVVIRWNPDDITKLYVYNKDGKKICEAPSQELLAMGPKITEKALEDHIKRQKRQYREAKEVIREMQMPFEDRMAAAADDLAVSRTCILQETKESNTKVVQLTTDKQFKDKMKEKNNVIKESESNSNEFFEQQAEKAFAMLENL